MLSCIPRPGFSLPQPVDTHQLLPSLALCLPSSRDLWSFHTQVEEEGVLGHLQPTLLSDCWISCPLISLLQTGVRAAQQLPLFCEWDIAEKEKKSCPLSMQTPWRVFPAHSQSHIPLHQLQRALASPGSERQVTANLAGEEGSVAFPGRQGVHIQICTQYCLSLATGPTQMAQMEVGMLSLAYIPYIHGMSSLREEYPCPSPA